MQSAPEKSTTRLAFPLTFLASQMTVSRITLQTRIQVRHLVRTATACLALILALVCAVASAEPHSDSLEENFRQPPSDAKNWVIWVWLRTPTTPAAMTRDLEEMKAKGIAGFILYHPGAGTGDALPSRLPWSPEFREEMRHVARESKRLGLTFVLTIGPSGVTAPGLDPQYSDQELKWTALEVTGPMTFDGVLALPEKSNEEDRKDALNEDGSPMFRDLRVVAVPVKKPIELTEIQDLSSKIDGSGKLSWDVPAGQWKILRFIQRPKNKVERWGERYATYCDLLSPEGVAQAWALTMAPLLKEMTPEERAGLAGVFDDSYEGGHGDWTQNLSQEFQKRRGYDVLPYLPVLAGETIGDEGTTAGVKRDFLQTKTEMIADNYFGRLQQLCHQNGLELYSETTNWPNYEWNGHQWFTSRVDHSMGEFWHTGRQFNRDCATANHIFGRKITMSEAFTEIGPYWEETPFFLKGLVDRAYCEGMNRVAICNYSHSPLLDAKPGLVFMAATIMNHNITWWEEAPAFFQYMERCQAMLQHGDFAADVLWLAGDGLTGGWETKGANLELRGGHDYDRISNDNLVELASFKDGRIVLPSGMKYQVLVMPPFHQKMSLAALRKIAEFAEAGATIIGARPLGISGLQLQEEDQKEFDHLKARLWGNHPDPQAASDTSVGQGRVVNGKQPWKIMQEMGLGPDFEYEGLSEKGEVNWIHRQSADADWYFVSSRGLSPEKLTCRFRITGKQPELWDAVTGSMRDATAFRQDGGHTIVPLEFDPSGSVFVVFRKPIAPTVAGTAVSNHPAMKQLGQLDGEWRVAFEPQWGGPAEPVAFDSLVDWTSRPEEGIKYYSGSALYTKTFDAPGGIEPGRKLMLDLGEVREVASVTLNGKDLGVVWARPARVDVTDVLEPRGNQLELKIVNLWPNRLIGDDALPPEKQYTKFNMRNYYGKHLFAKDSPLRPSGLLGPVTIVASGDSDDDPK